MNPPAKVSPAPVGSWTSSRGTAGTLKARFELRKDVQFRAESRALVHVFVVTPGPEKCLPGRAFESRSVHAAASKDGCVLIRKVIPHDSDEIDVREEARGNGKIGGRAAQHAVDFPERRFDGVERHRPHDKSR